MAEDRTSGTTKEPGNAAARTPSEPGGDDYLRIDQVAARTGFTKRTLRYYEELGLLAPPTRTEGGYRLYSLADVQHLQRIKRLKDLLGFSLAEIREIAQAEEEREQVRAAWQRETNPVARMAWLDRAEELTRRQLQLVEEKLTGLEDMRANLVARLARYEQQRSEQQGTVASEQSN